MHERFVCMAEPDELLIQPRLTLAQMHEVENKSWMRCVADRPGTSRRPLSLAAPKPFDKNGALGHKTTSVEDGHRL